MKTKGQGSIIILTILGIAILFISVIGATFAYFTVNLQITETEKKAILTSRTLVIEFDSKNSIYYDNAIPGRPTATEGEELPNVLKFSLTSPVDMTEKNGYDVYLDIQTNTFITNNLVYYIKQNECVRKDNSGSRKGELISEEKIDFDYDGELVQLGTIPAGYTGMLKVAGGSVLGALGCSDEWEIEIWLHELGVEQNEDQAREFKATVEIETGAIYPFDYKFYD